MYSFGTHIVESNLRGKSKLQRDWLRLKVNIKSTSTSGSYMIKKENLRRVSLERMFTTNYQNAILSENTSGN